MNTLLIIILIVAALAGVTWVLTKYFNLFADADEDGIPDEVEDTIEDVTTAVKKTTKEVKRRAKRVKDGSCIIPFFNSIGGFDNSSNLIPALFK